jgi:hypothetical protein
MSAGRAIVASAKERCKFERAGKLPCGATDEVSIWPAVFVARFFQPRKWKPTAAPLRPGAAAERLCANGFKVPCASGFATPARPPNCQRTIGGHGWPPAQRVARDPRKCWPFVCVGKGVADVALGNSVLAIPHSSWGAGSDFLRFAPPARADLVGTMDAIVTRVLPAG